MNGADCQNSIKTSTDPIKAEIAKIKSTFDLQQKSRELAELFKEVNQMVGGFGGYNDKDGITIQVDFKSIMDITLHPVAIKRGHEDWPFRLSKEMSGIEYFAILSREKWLEFAKDNNLCPDCGKDFAEYMDYDQNEEKMFYGCRECRNGEETGRAV